MSRYGKGRRQDARQLSLVPDAAPPVMNPELADRLKALEGLIAYPFDSPIRGGSQDFYAIESILKQVKQRRRLSTYWLNRVATLISTYKAQGYLRD